MPAPTDADLKYYGGVNPTPDDDTDDLGGAISTGSELDQTADDLLIANIAIPASGGNIDYYGVAYRRNEASGSLRNARLALRTGMRFNAAGGPAQLVAAAAGVTGNVVLTGYVSGVLTQETIAMSGVTPVVSSTTWDAGGLIRADYGAIPAASITVSVAGETVGVIWRTVTRGGTTILGTIMCTAEFALATASAKNATLSSTDRRTAPGSISSFSQATRWDGADASISVPGGTLAAGDYIGYVLRLRAYQDNYPTVTGDLVASVELVGTPVA